jgi:N12 class adenine-specific DNA methylase
MKASEIVDKLKSVLLSAEEPQLEAAEEQVEELELSAEQVGEIEVNEPVVLAEDGEEPSEEVAEDSPEEMKYATKQELESAVAEMRAMYEAIMEKMGSDELETEIPN